MRRSLENKMTLLISLLLAATLSMLAFFAMVYFEGQLKAMISSQQFTMVSAIADQIDDKLQAALSELTFVAATIPPEVLADPAAAQKFIESRPDTLAMFDNGAFLFSASGRMIAGKPVEFTMLHKDYSDRDYFKQTIAKRKSYISEPFISAQAHRPPVIALTVPIFDVRGNLTAILAGGIELMKDNFLGGLASVRLGEQGYLYLYNTSRTMIVHRDRSRILKQDVPPGVNRLFDQAIEGFEGTGETVTSKGVHVFSSFKRLQSADWILAANFPVSEAYAPVYKAKRYVSGTLAVVFIGAIVVVRLFMKHLTAPLLSLTRQVEGLAGGEKTQVSIATNDEIGILAKAFNTLLADLDSQRKELQAQLRFSQLMIDTLPNGVFYKDAQGRYLGCNKAFEAFVGMSMEQLKGKTIRDVASPELAEIYLQSDRILFRDQGVQIYETKVQYGDGTLRDVIFSKATFSSDDGTLGGLIGSMTDITERRQAESELAAQKEFSESLVQNSTAPTFVLDSQHRVVIWNQACEKLTGAKAADMLGTRAWRAFYDEERPVLADVVLDHGQASIGNLYDTFSQSGSIPGGLQAERWFCSLNGSALYIIFHAAPIRNSRGDVVAAIQTIEDITHRKLQEDRLRQLSLAVEQSPVSVVITDTEGAIKYVNRQFTELTGYTVQEVMGRNPRMLKGGTLPETYTQLWQTITSGKEWRGEFLNAKKNGEHYWESATISPVRNEEGTVTQFIALKVDITEKKNAEQSLVESEHKLRGITDTATDAIILVDDENRVAYWNRAAETIFGYSRDEIMGHPIDPVIPSRYRQIHGQGFARFAQNGEGPLIGKTSEVSARRKDGHEFPIELSISGIQLNGKWHAAGIVRDVSERRSLENQLRHVQKMEALGTFAGGIAHDFNNILTAITAYCELIQRKTTADSPVRPYLEKLLGSTDRASTLTRSLLAYSRKQPLNPQPVEINSIIAKVDHLLSRLVGEDVEVSIHSAGGCLTVLADSLQIEQVLMNLAVNARDAMPGGGLLQIGTDRVLLDAEFIRSHGYGEPGEYAVLSVSDTGCGMDEVTRQRIFEPFFTTKGIDKGTGLGLSIAYGIVKQHNGYINVYSEVGKGTTFTVYLPLTNLAEESNGSPKVAMSGAGSETILLVEDDADIRETLKELLQEQGYKIIEAENGEDATIQFQRHGQEIRLLILDLMMPKKSGKAVYEEIRAERPDVKALFISGYPADLLHAKGALQEDVHFIMKPIMVNDLLAKIREILD